LSGAAADVQVQLIARSSVTGDVSLNLRAPPIQKRGLTLMQERSLQSANATIWRLLPDDEASDPLSTEQSRLLTEEVVQLVV